MKKEHKKTAINDRFLRKGLPQSNTISLPYRLDSYIHKEDIQWRCGWIAFPYRLDYPVSKTGKTHCCGWIAFPYRLDFPVIDPEVIGELRLDRVSLSARL